MYKDNSTKSLSIFCLEFALLVDCIDGCLEMFLLKWD